MRRYLAPFRRHFNILTLRIHDVRRCNVVFFFFTSKPKAMHVNVSVTVKTVSGISLFGGGKLEEFEGYMYCFVVFYIYGVYERIK